MLEGQLAVAAHIGQYQPISAIVRVTWLRFVSGAVFESQKLAVELRQASNIGSIQDCVEELGETGHRRTLTASTAPDHAWGLSGVPSWVPTAWTTSEHVGPGLPGAPSAPLPVWAVPDPETWVPGAQPGVPRPYVYRRACDSMQGEHRELPAPGRSGRCRHPGLPAVHAGKMRCRFGGPEAELLPG